MEIKTLIMYFIDENAKKASVSIDEPKFDITETEVKTAMTEIITDDVLRGSSSAKFLEPHSAQIVTRTIEELAIE